MKILQVINSLDYGGAETHLLRLCNSLHQQGHEVRVVSLRPPKAFVDDLTNMGILVMTLSMPAGIPDPRAIFSLARIIKRFKPDIVHSHIIHANLLARAARIFSPIPRLICTAHNIHEGSRWLEYAYRATDFLCDINTQVSLAGAKDYIKRGLTPEHKMLHIANGINIESTTSIVSRDEARQSMGLQGHFVWLAVGRLTTAKDIPNMISAFERIYLAHSSSRKVRLLIAGDGPLYHQLATRLENSKLQAAIQLLGIRQDIQTLMQAADAFIMSSAWEGLPMVLLEAGTNSLPTVATNVGGNPEAIKHGITGIIVPPHNSLALAEGMDQLMRLSDPQRAAMGSAAREHVIEHYDMRALTQRWLALYKNAD